MCFYLLVCNMKKKNIHLSEYCLTSKPCWTFQYLLYIYFILFHQRPNLTNHRKQLHLVFYVQGTWYCFFFRSRNVVLSLTCKERGIFFAQGTWYCLLRARNVVLSCKCQECCIYTLSFSCKDHGIYRLSLTCKERGIFFRSKNMVLSFTCKEHGIVL